ncbi:FAD-dependent sensor of blue light [Rathayibacter sp. PhB127]|uniref:BLUF domain-containing protein n=1 Tax=unclassified Rathayibacter TaxID=2609250 RepID=UPI000F4CF121|nr:MULTISPECIES: BLUF domain-containing protein [unclassified Rathayibacter]ROS23323.1 FAD-dependent sensor of blue light [Rathayibacter sp. PhB127]TDX81310.1 FAD-dependent sensor of blue light [Rathayibacter sp. PhB151]
MSDSAARPSQDDDLRSIVYASHTAAGLEEADLPALLEQCRANNERLGLTGILLFRDGRFLQLLEGPDATLRERMAIIADDPRHAGLRVLLEEAPAQRLFPSWTMAYEAITDSMTTELPGYRSTFEDIDTDVDASATLPALRELIRWFQVRH